MPYQTAHGIRYFRHPDRKQRLEPLRAWRAMGKLLEDGEDTKQAFEIAAALSGKSLEKNFQRFLSEPSGPDLFIRREELVDRLSDDAWLDTMPEGSFGATYRDFTRRENISARGLEAESEKSDISEERFDDDLAWYARRLRDIHDLWHVLTGYGRDGLGEVSLLAFSHSQTGNFGLIFITHMATHAMKKELAGSENLKPIVREARVNGKAAFHLPNADYIALFPQPLKTVREALGVEKPVRYLDYRPSYMAQIDAVNAEAPTNAQAA